jgi:hypothetical protein
VKSHLDDRFACLATAAALLGAGWLAGVLVASSAHRAVTLALLGLLGAAIWAGVHRAGGG